MKLELKHIAPYLPYGLKCKTKICDFDSDNLIIAIGGIIKGCVRFYHGYEYCDQYLEDVKPILRPLSDLTKEIEVNGERFVPIVELAKISDNTFVSEISVKSKSKIHGCRYKDAEETINVFAYHDDNFCFGLHIENQLTKSLDFSVTPNQLQLFEFLFKNHFDVFGLIENGLAIDINTLEK